MQQRIESGSLVIITGVIHQQGEYGIIVDSDKRKSGYGTNTNEYWRYRIIGRFGTLIIDKSYFKVVD